MKDFEVDHSNCDREPIHIPGHIQAHGFLVVVNNKYFITYLSENVFDFINGTTSDLLGKPIKYFELFFKNAHQPDFITQLLNFGIAKNSFEQINPFVINIDGVNFNLIVSISAENYILEFEPAISSDEEVDVQRMIGHSITQMLADKKLDSLLKNTAIQIKNIINYDRVMIYRFRENDHGEVVAEAKNEGMESWLGLHYPASDIPKQARELYKHNLTRLIADVNITPSKIITSADNTQPLDLTSAQLRAVSPMHIKYLINIGIASSFSISLMYKNELWGLIACHNYLPKYIDFKSRESSKLIGQILSSALEFRHDEENQERFEKYKHSLDKLSKYLQKSISIEDALTAQRITMLDVVNASGSVLMYEKNVVKLGITPNDEQLAHLIKWVKNNITPTIYYTSKLSSVYPEAAVYQNVASGIMLFVLSKELEEYAIWFKPEIIKTIKWVEDPLKEKEFYSDGSVKLSPRNSFTSWSQLVSGTSESWASEEIKSILRLREEITYTINQKASAIRLLNEKLRQAYEELDTFSFTISHDLKNPITAIKGYLQILALQENMGDDMVKIIGRITERTDKMNNMIGEVLNYSRIGRADIKYENINIKCLIEDVIKDLDQVYKINNLKITFGNMPDVSGDKVMMQQVFSNLISNAVKYSQYKNPGEVHIEGTVTENSICYSIKDNGLGIAAEDYSNIFGLFKRMNNAKEIEGSGVGLAIVKRIVEKHFGKIWVESELGKGSTFFITFNK